MGASFRLPLSHCTGCGRDARDPRRAAENTFLSAEFALTPGGKRQRSTKKHEGNTKEGQLQKRGGRICAEPTPSSATWRSANSQIAERRGEHRRRIGFSLRSCAVLRGSVALCSRKSLSHCTGCGRDVCAEPTPSAGPWRFALTPGGKRQRSTKNTKKTRRTATAEGGGRKRQTANSDPSFRRIGEVADLRCSSSYSLALSSISASIRSL